MASYLRHNISAGLGIVSVIPFIYLNNLIILMLICRSEPLVTMCKKGIVPNIEMSVEKQPLFIPEDIPHVCETESIIHC